MPLMYWSSYVVQPNMPCQAKVSEWLQQVQKSVINDAGIHFSGHTEYYQEFAGVPRVVMMLATKTLRVALATTHLPLRAVADAITRNASGD